MIYIDPPYGIKFGSNWQVSTRNNRIGDTKAEDITRQPEQVRAFRDTWQFGINSYLSYLRDRLVAARELLTETGSIFIQINDDNVHHVREVMDEVFGDDNFIALIPFRKKTMPFGTTYLEQMDDFLIWYAKCAFDSFGSKVAKYHRLYQSRSVEGEFHHCWFETQSGERVRMSKHQLYNHSLLPPNSRVYRLKSLEPSGPMKSGMFDQKFEGKVYSHPQNGYGTSPEGLLRVIKTGRIQPEGNRLTYILYADEGTSSQLTSPWTDTIGPSDKIFVVQTHTEVVKRCLLMTTDPGDLVLDPTCGSGTTAYVAEQWGRRWITIDTSRVALALARTRLMAAKYPYYLLADSKAGIEKEAEITGKFPPDYKTTEDIRKGFVYKRVPHITLKDIANNTEIDALHEKWQKQLDPIRRELNQLLKKKWEEWEIPREADEKWSREAKSLLEKWWELRRCRQAELDASIARNADQEVLYDQPYEDNKRVRVSGPFTFESLSPHRVLSPDEHLSETETNGRKSAEAVQFETMILDNLKSAGVQNTIKNERLKFDRLETFAGEWIQAKGEYTEKDGAVRRVAVSIGPEHGTVGPRMVKEAAKEAVKGVGFDLLIVCGFAFDPHVSEEAKRYGSLTVLPCRMNADLAMGDELLKKTGAGNLFMVFGEPDIEIKKAKAGKVQIEIKGLDIYDPTTGQIRSNSTDDIACWFIDTSYNEESFFVRHAYFTGGDEPYDKLKRALRAEIDEAAWSALYSTKSRPFDPPATGKIAVKVINHYGDEVLKVYEV
ncbi:MAG: DNA methyltransferase [Thermodesulfobacteriota bacterium]